MDVFFVHAFNVLYIVLHEGLLLNFKKKNNFSRWDINIVEF